MWRPLLLLALWLGTVGVGRAQLTAAQHQGLQVALEEFHKHPRVQWAFQKTSMDSATDMVSGTARGGGPAPHNASTFPGSTCKSTQLSGEGPPAQPPTRMCCPLSGGEVGHIQELFCTLSWLLAFLCLSVGSPSRRGHL